MNVVKAILLIPCLCAAAAAQPYEGPDTLWTYEYRGPQDDMGADLIPDSDGGFVFAVESEAVTVDSGRAILIKLDSGGHEIWRRLYRDWHMGIVSAVTETPDGGFVLAGAGNVWWQSIAVLRTDSEGNPLWYRYYNIPAADWGVDIIVTIGGGLAVLTKGGSGYLPEVALLRLSESGDSLWTVRYGGDGIDWGGELLQTEDGGFQFCGMRHYRQPSGRLAVRAWVVKTDSLGGIEWEREIGTEGNYWCYSLAPAAEGSCVIAGWYDSTGTAEVVYPFAARITASGDSLWARVWRDVRGGFQRCRVLPDGGFALFGTFISHDPYRENYGVMRIDADGNRLWTRTYGSAPMVLGTALAVLSDGSLGIGGWAWSGGATGWDAWLARTESAISATNEHPFPPDSPLLLLNYPNPFNSTTTLGYSLARPDFIELSIFDILGRRVAMLSEGQQTAGDHNLQWNASAFPSGVYLVRLSAGSSLQTKKVVLLK